MPPIDFQSRSTTDLVVLVITFIIGAILIISTAAVIVIELVNPETDTNGLVEMESEVLGVLVGALVGFIGGRSTGRHEASVRPSNEPSVDHAGTSRLEFDTEAATATNRVR